MSVLLRSQRLLQGLPVLGNTGWAKTQLAHAQQSVLACLNTQLSCLQMSSINTPVKACRVYVAGICLSPWPAVVQAEGEHGADGEYADAQFALLHERITNKGDAEEVSQMQRDISSIKRAIGAPLLAQLQDGSSSSGELQNISLLSCVVIMPGQACQFFAKGQASAAAWCDCQLLKRSPVS